MDTLSGTRTKHQGHSTYTSSHVQGGARWKEESTTKPQVRTTKSEVQALELSDTSDESRATQPESDGLPGLKYIVDMLLHQTSRAWIRIAVRRSSEAVVRAEEEVTAKRLTHDCPTFHTESVLIQLSLGVCLVRCLVVVYRRG